jgi:2,4-dienoyl-CoA reductase-like NADH-dependent reductase (Old Yellow Enzyme family)
VFNGPLVLNSDYFFDNAAETLAGNKADAISFGRTFMANPDLPERFRNGAELNSIDFTPTWYSQGPEGYIDYPTMKQGSEASA